MARELDFKWLEAQAEDQQSRAWLSRIRAWRARVFEADEYPDGDELFTMRLGGRTLWFRTSDAFSAIEAYVEIFQEESHGVMPGFSGRENPVVLDVGANQGFYALRLKAQNPACRIICVEPNPHVFEILRRNMESNAIRDVSLIQKAAGPADGRCRMEFVKRVSLIGGKTVAREGRPWLSDGLIENVEVDCIRLATLCRDAGLSRIDLLKVDVEGEEQAILEDSRELLGRVRRVVVERHSRDLRDSVVALMAAAGFNLVWDEDPECRRYYGDLYFERTPRADEGSSGRG